MHCIGLQLGKEWELEKRRGIQRFPNQLAFEINLENLVSGEAPHSEWEL